LGVGLTVGSSSRRAGGVERSRSRHIVPSAEVGADCFHLDTEGYEHLARNLWDGYYASRFTGAVFTDGFESGDTSAWTLVVP